MDLAKVFFSGMDTSKAKKAVYQANLDRYFGAVQASRSVSLESQSQEPVSADEIRERQLTKTEDNVMSIHHDVHNPEPVSMSLDISYYTKGRATNLDADTKYRLIQERVPPTGFKFPGKAYRDKRKVTGVMNRYCQREWFDAFRFISYSKTQDGLYCLCCVLFPTTSPSCQPKLFVKQPYTKL